MRACAEIDEIAVAIERDFFVRRNVFDDVDFKFARLLSIAQRGEAAFLAELERFVARYLCALERMVGFDLLFHLCLDLFEILRRNAVRKIDIIIETVLDRRPGGELRLGPYFQNRSRQDVRRGMA